MNPQDHNFNWVRASQECTILAGFQMLRDGCRESYEDVDQLADIRNLRDCL